MKKIGLGVLLLAVAATLTAQEKKGYDYHTGAEIGQKQQDLLKEAATKPSSWRIADYGDHIMTMSAQTKSSAPEMHEHWSDVIIVTNGKATLLTGGTIVNPVGRGAAGSGEMGGSDITGANTQVIQQGDVVNIPAGTPHWIKLAPGDTFAYLIVKVKKS
jgi:mannose-6-phosphate isomerase-like protein (cupin superfamily)